MQYKRWVLCIFALTLWGIVHAEVDTLTKLRAINGVVWPGTDNGVIWPDAGYDLALMGENAVPFLLQVLKDTNREARWHAAYFLAQYADARALSGLTEAFLHDSDEYVRGTSAWALASVGAKYASELIVNQLDNVEDPVAQNRAVSILSAMEDKRIIPTLVQRLENPETRQEAALALGRFRDKRAVPALIEMLNHIDYGNSYFAERAIEILEKIGDKRAIPVLLKLLDSPLQLKVASVLPNFGISIVAPLLKMMKQTKPGEVRDRIVNILGRIHDPRLAATYGQLFLKSEDWGLRGAMAQGLANMGASGIEYLLASAKKEDYYYVALQWLSTYNSQTVVDAVVKLASDASNPSRLQWTFRTLQTLWPVWGTDLMPSALKLLRNRAPLVRLHTIRLFRDLEIREAEPALREATQDPDERVRLAASSVLASFSGISPLVLAIEIDQERYRYGEPVELKYQISNMSNDVVTICTFGMFTPDVIRELFIRVEIHKPDGTMLNYRGPIACGGMPSKEDYRTLQTGDALSGHIPISQFYPMSQPGRYTAKLHYRPLDDGVQFGFWGWVGTLTSQEVSFKVAHPSVRQFKTMLADISIQKMNDEKPWKDPFKRVKVMQICNQLGELRDPRAIQALQKLALYKPEDLEGYSHDFTGSALNALAKFPQRELVPMWIERLNDASMREIAIEALVIIGDASAIEPLRHMLFGGSDAPIRVALALKSLGDNRGIEWLKVSALRKLEHWDAEQRQDAIRILSQIHTSDGLRAALADKHPKVRSAARYWLSAMAKDIGFAELESMLADSDLNVQKATAYQLALLGNAVGLHLIKPDLEANDVETREVARHAFLAARGIGRK